MPRTTSPTISFVWIILAAIAALAMIAPAIAGVYKWTDTGTPVYIMGTPLSESLSYTVTRGIVSAVRKMEDEQLYYQTDAGVNPGNSGGPAFDPAGEVVAMAVSGLLTRQGGSLNINFLIPIDEVLGSLTVV